MFVKNSEIQSSASFRDAFTLAQLGESGEAVVKWCAEREAAPRAASRAAVKENCQGWTIRVLRRLQQAGIVDQKWIGYAESIQEAV